MNRAKTFRLVLSAFTVLVFFHLCVHFGLAKRERPFDPTHFFVEVVLLVVLGIAVFKVTKDKDP